MACCGSWSWPVAVPLSSPKSGRSGAPIIVARSRGTLGDGVRRCRTNRVPPGPHLDLREQVMHWIGRTDGAAVLGECCREAVDADFHGAILGNDRGEAPATPMRCGLARTVVARPEITRP